MGKWNAIALHGIVMKAYKKYIFQYIIGKAEHVDALMPQNIRIFFPFDRRGIKDAIVQYGYRERNQ
jgi:hypothetical protein